MDIIFVALVFTKLLSVIIFLKVFFIRVLTIFWLIGGSFFIFILFLEMGKMFHGLFFAVFDLRFFEVFDMGVF